MSDVWRILIYLHRQSILSDTTWFPFFPSINQPNSFDRWLGAKTNRFRPIKPSDRATDLKLTKAVSVLRRRTVADTAARRPSDTSYNPHCL